MTPTAQPAKTTRRDRGARERILNTAYELFSQHGVGATGIDTIIAQAGVAKTTLYRHFRSKEELVLAFLDRRETIWTRQWLESGIVSGGETPSDHLLAIFDIFNEWFQRSDFEGCSFINVLLEAVPNSPIHQSAAHHLAKIRVIIAKQASEAGLVETDRFAATWTFLMKGCIIAANEGNRQAARQAKQAAAVLLANWPRV